MGERRTTLRVRKKKVKTFSKVSIDPTYYLTNTGTGYTSLWELSETAPSSADDTTSVTFDKNVTGYYKVIPGTENTSNLSSLPSTFDQYGWRTSGTLNGSFASGDWTFYVTIITGKYVCGNYTVYVRLWKSSNADGSSATALTDWLTIATQDSPAADTTYNLSGTVSLSSLSLSNEYLFVEYAIGTTSACGSSQGCPVTFRCNEGSNQRIVTTTLSPAVDQPTVTTNSATNVGTLHATLNGEITDTGGENADERGFEWGTESGSYPNSWTETGSFGVESFDHEITSLQPKTTYYYRAKAHNSAGWGYGSEQSFTTLGYKIEGQCIDENGNPIEGAEVRLYKSADNSYESSTTSQSDGSYSFTGLSDNNQRYAIAWKSNTEKRVGTTDNLTPVEEG